MVQNKSEDYIGLQRDNYNYTTHKYFPSFFFHHCVYSMTGEGTITKIKHYTGYLLSITHADHSIACILPSPTFAA